MRYAGEPCFNQADVVYTGNFANKAPSIDVEPFTYTISSRMDHSDDVTYLGADFVLTGMDRLSEKYRFYVTTIFVDLVFGLDLTSPAGYRFYAQAFVDDGGELKPGDWIAEDPSHGGTIICGDPDPYSCKLRGVDVSGLNMDDYRFVIGVGRIDYPDEWYTTPLLSLLPSIDKRLTNHTEVEIEDAALVYDGDYCAISMATIIVKYDKEFIEKFGYDVPLNLGIERYKSGGMDGGTTHDGIIDSDNGTITYTEFYESRNLNSSTYKLLARYNGGDVLGYSEAAVNFTEGTNKFTFSINFQDTTRYDRDTDCPGLNKTHNANIRFKVENFDRIPEKFRDKFTFEAIISAASGNGNAPDKNEEPWININGKNNNKQTNHPEYTSSGAFVSGDTFTLSIWEYKENGVPIHVFKNLNYAWAYIRTNSYFNIFAHQRFDIFVGCGFLPGFAGAPVSLDVTIDGGN